MRRDKAYLIDMLNAAEEVMEFVREITFEQFEQSLLYQRAITKSLEIIGEAASRVSNTIRESYPNIPWGRLLG